MQFTKMFGFLALGFVFLSTSAALGQNVTWEKVKVVGGGDGERCNQANVIFVPTGQEANFTLSTFGISMPRKNQIFGGRLSWSASCNLTATVVIPQGFYMRTLTQDLSGSVLKDYGAAGALSSNGFLFQSQVPLNQINIVLKPDEVYDSSNGFIEKRNTQIFDLTTVKAQCALTRNQPLRTEFKFQLLAAGARPVQLVNFLMNIASQDVFFRLDSSLGSCAEVQ